ncbi:MAG: 50S ribosomal protein L15e [Candidatus Micrarchaeota archaeon]|nr:50S ribosomal protein L15e [Candidatus Micrarchaeota archaeon]
MGMYKYVRESFAATYKHRPPEYRAKIAAWRKRTAVERVEKPYNPIRARALGYRAKKEFVTVRVRVKKGKRRLAKRASGRKPGKNIKYRPLSFSLQRLAEQRAAKDYCNLRVVGSYYVGEEGMNKYFEVILRNPFLSSKPDRPLNQAAPVKKPAEKPAERAP